MSSFKSDIRTELLLNISKSPGLNITSAIFTKDDQSFYYCFLTLDTLFIAFISILARIPLYWVTYYLKLTQMLILDYF